MEAEWQWLQRVRRAAAHAASSCSKQVSRRQGEEGQGGWHRQFSLNKERCYGQRCAATVLLAHHL